MWHGYVFSMAVGTIGEWLKLVPFWLGDKQLILTRHNPPLSPAESNGRPPNNL